MNRVEIRGGLVKDVAMEDKGGLMKATFTLAVNGTRYDGQTRQQVVKTAFISVEAWGVVAEGLYESGAITKGSELYVVGELVQTKGDDNKSHTRVAAFTISPTRVVQARQQQEPPPEESNPWADPTGQTRG